MTKLTLSKQTRVFCKQNKHAKGVYHAATLDADAVLEVDTGVIETLDYDHRQQQFYPAKFVDEGVPAFDCFVLTQDVAVAA